MDMTIIKKKVNKVIATITFPCEINSSLDTGRIHLFSNDLPLLITIKQALSKPKMGIRCWIGNCLGGHKYYLCIDRPEDITIVAYRDGLKLLKQEWTYEII